MKGDRPPRRRPEPVVRGHSSPKEARRDFDDFPEDASPRAVVGARIYDLLIALLVAIWLGGGIPWGARTLLRHGADPRRAALIVGFVGAWLFKRFEPDAFYSSRVIRWARIALDRLREPVVRAAVLGGCAAWAIALGVAQTMALRAPLYDVGIFHQILWGLSHGYGFLSTVSKAGNFLLDHLAPSLALLTPVYWLTGSSPLTLAIVQPLLLYGGVAAWVYLASRVPGAKPELRAELAAAATVFGISFDSLWGNLHWGFHENTIAFCALSWAFALLFPYLHDAIIDPWATGAIETAAIQANERPSKKLVIVACLLVAAGSKEILLVDVACVFFVWAVLEFLQAQDDRVGRGSTLAAALFSMAGVLLLVFLGYESVHHPADKNYFERYYSYLGHDFSGVASSLVSSPGAVARTIGLGTILHYAVSVFLPWFFLPLFWGQGPDRLWLLALAPSFLSAALASYPPLRSLDFHYALELWPLLAALTILQLARLRSKSLIWAWAGLSLLMMDHDPWGALRENIADARRLAPVREELVSTPLDLSVMADDLAGPWISGRPMIARWPDLDLFGHSCPKLLIARVDDRGQSLDQPPVLEVLKRCSTLSPRVSVIWKAEEWRAYLPW